MERNKFFSSKYFLFIGTILVLFILYSSYGHLMNFISDVAFSYPENKKGNYSVDIYKNRTLVTEEGITLSSRIFKPRELEKAPTILVRIPLTYSLTDSLKTELVGRFWSTRGYVVVIQGTRGRYRSSGEFYPLIHERKDGLETLKWLRNQSWFDGDLFMWGSSSFAHTQWAISNSTDPKIKAYFMHIGSSNFKEMFYPGGAFSLASALYWTIRSRGQEDREVDLNDLAKGVEILPVVQADNIAIGDTDFFNDWVMNRGNLSFWEKIDGSKRTESIKGPVLHLAGWYDPFLISQLDDFHSLKGHSDPFVAKNTKLIIGPWKHADSVNLPNGEKVTYRENSVWPTTPWFDEILLKRDSVIPEVKIFVMGVNTWREENEWPLRRTVFKPFYLKSLGKANTIQGDGKLSFNKDSSGGDFDSFTYDPLNPVPSAGGAMLGPWGGIRKQNEIEKREDVLIYDGPILSAPLEITGPLEAYLYVESSAKTTDFTVKLVDVYPDGTAYNISDGIIRIEEMSVDQETPKKIKIRMRPTSNVFQAGHKLRIEISSSNFPRYERNLNLHQDLVSGRKTIKAGQKVFHSGEYPSFILLPTIPNN